MTTKKKAPTTPTAVTYKLGAIEARLETNDEQHKIILENLEEIKEKISEVSRMATVVSVEAKSRDLQHQVILDKVSILCAAIEPIKISAAATGKQVEINTTGISDLDKDIHGENGIKTKVDSMVAKASIVGATVSFVVAVIFFFGKLFLSHLIPANTPPIIGP